MVEPSLGVGPAMAVCHSVSGGRLRGHPTLFFFLVRPPGVRVLATGNHQSATVCRGIQDRVLPTTLLHRWFSRVQLVTPTRHLLIATELFMLRKAPSTAQSPALWYPTTFGRISGFKQRFMLVSCVLKVPREVFFSFHPSPAANRRTCENIRVLRVSSLC